MLVSHKIFAFNGINQTRVSRYAVAFGSNVFSFIPPVRALGMYAAFTVVANYALVLTLLPAALILRGKGARKVFKEACLGFSSCGGGGGRFGRGRGRGAVIGPAATKTAMSELRGLVGSPKGGGGRGGMHGYTPLGSRSAEPSGAVIGSGAVGTRVGGEVELQEVCLYDDEEDLVDEMNNTTQTSRRGSGVRYGPTVKNGGGGGGGAGKDDDGGEPGGAWSEAAVEDGDASGGGAAGRPSVLVALRGKLRDDGAAAEASLGAATAAAIDALGDFVVRFRLIIIAAGLVATFAAAASIATSLRVARVPPPLLRPDTNLQRIQYLLFDVFYTENWSNVKVAFGVAGVDRSTADPNDPSSFGQPLWDPAFDFAHAGVQLAVLAACDAILSARDTLAFTPSAGKRECVLQAYVRDAGGKDAVEWGGKVPERLAEWARDKGRNWRDNLGWAGEEGASRLKFITADYFVDLHPAASTTEEIRSVHAAWEAVMVDARMAMRAAMERGNTIAVAGTAGTAGAVGVVAGGARGARGGDSSVAVAGDGSGGGGGGGETPPPAVFQACDVWNRMGVEESVRYTAKVSPVVSAAAAAAIMFAATRSWRVTLAALATITAAVLLMLAALVLVGWEFGVVEELCVTLLIGSSIDYCIHLAMAYSEAAAESSAPAASAGAAGAGARDGQTIVEKRGERTRAALRSMAPTLTGAAATTVGGGGSRFGKVAGEPKFAKVGSDCETFSFFISSLIDYRAAPYSLAMSSAMLLACQVEVLVKIGATIVANTVVGYLLSLMLFSALMATFGD
jgi:hypothetical protein